MRERHFLRPTTLIEARRLSKRLGSELDLTIASETFQHTGSFKFRAAYNVAANVNARHHPHRVFGKLRPGARLRL